MCTFVEERNQVFSRSYLDVGRVSQKAEGVHPEGTFEASNFVSQYSISQSIAVAVKAMSFTGVGGFDDS